MIAKSGGNINIESESGRTPLHYAAANGMLLQWNNILPINYSLRFAIWENTMSPFNWAGNKECVEILIKHGANLDSKDEDGETPLAIAMSKGLETNL